MAAGGNARAGQSQLGQRKEQEKQSQYLTSTAVPAVHWALSADGGST